METVLGQQSDTMRTPAPSVTLKQPQAVMGTYHDDTADDEDDGGAPEAF